MPTSRHVQTSLSAGEFDPLLWSREDVAFFYNSARIIENAVPLPQGGAKRREGWRFRALQRGPISSISLGGATVTAANGGTVANLTDGYRDTFLQTGDVGFLETRDVGTATEYEIARLDLGSAQAVSLFDARDLRIGSLPAGISTANLTLQTSSDGSTWSDVASISVGNISYDRRFGAAPDTLLGTARYWRVIVDNASALDLKGATDRKSVV